MQISGSFLEAFRAWDFTMLYHRESSSHQTDGRTADGVAHWLGGRTEYQITLQFVTVNNCQNGNFKKIVTALKDNAKIFCTFNFWFAFQTESHAFTTPICLKTRIILVIRAHVLLSNERTDYKISRPFVKNCDTEQGNICAQSAARIVAGKTGISAALTESAHPLEYISDTQSIRNGIHGSRTTSGIQYTGSLLDPQRPLATYATACCVLSGGAHRTRIDILCMPNPAFGG